MISPKEAADQMRKLGELFATVAPHIEDMDTLQERKNVLEKRVGELQRIANEAIEARDNAVAGARQGVQEAMNAADAHKQGVLAEIEGKRKAAEEAMARIKQDAKAQQDQLGGMIGSLQLQVRDLTAQREALLVHVSKLKTSLQDSMAAL